MLEGGTYSYGGLDLIQLLWSRVAPGAYDASQVKAEFLYEIANGTKTVKGLSPKKAVTMLGGMKGGYCLNPLIKLLEAGSVKAAEALKRTIYSYDLTELSSLAKGGNALAKEVLESLIAKEYTASEIKMAEEILFTVVKITGAVPTDWWSGPQQIETRPDTPMHSIFAFA